MFKFENVKYKNIIDIDDFIIKKNKITCIIGESGSGKTTILRMLNKMISPDSGKISYNGDSIEDIDSIELRRKVVMLSQNPAIYRGAIRDNLLIGQKFATLQFSHDEDLKNILRNLKLEKVLDDNAEELSGGEKQRIAIGRVMLMDAEVLLLDEPSSALDITTEDFVMENITKYVKDNKKSMVVVTHSKRLAETFGDSIFEVKNGMIFPLR